jgi:hypothetical protein
MAKRLFIALALALAIAGSAAAANWNTDPPAHPAVNWSN